MLSISSKEQPNINPDENPNICFNCCVYINKMRAPSLNLCDSCIKTEIIMNIHQRLISFNKEKFVSYDLNIKNDFISRCKLFLI